MNGASVTFLIKDSILSPLADAALKSFYYQRTAMPIEEQYAGQWHRMAGHPENHVLIYPSCASPDRPAGTIVSSSKGWYDAGDYNKYIVIRLFNRFDAVYLSAVSGLLLPAKMNKYPGEQ